MKDSKTTKNEKMTNSKMSKEEKAGLIGGCTTAGVGTAVATIGAPATMAAVGAFGTASTGAAISSLTGAAATSATLAAIGGGTVAAGGGGVVAGTAILAALGPIGLGVAVVGGLVAGGIAIHHCIKNSSPSAQ